MNKFKAIKQKLSVGQTNGMDMYATLSLDGEKIKRFKCDSMVGNFALFLRGQMHGGYTRRPMNPYTGSSYEEITDITEGEDDDGRQTTWIRHSWTSYFSNWGNGEHFVYIYGAKDDRQYLNGQYRIQRRSNTWVSLLHMDGSPVPYQDVGGHLGYARRVQIGRCARDGNEARRFQSWWPIVGTDNTPVNVKDIWLHSMCRHGSDVGELSHADKIISSLATNKPSSRFTITRSFTNNSDADITVRELGLASDYSTSFSATQTRTAKILLARDTLESGVVVPPTKTLTVDYEVIVELSPDTQDTDVDGTNGGFTAQFMNRLRLLAGFTDSWRASIFNMAAAGGDASANTNGSSYRGWDHGIQIGRDNSFTSMTDENLLDVIRHGDEIPEGEQGPQLWYHGMDIGDVEMDEVANKATFSMRRFFENKLDEPVTIKEIGMRGNISSSSNFTTHWQLARTALHPDDFITVQPGEFALVEYQVEVIV